MVLRISRRIEAKPQCISEGPLEVRRWALGLGVKKHDVLEYFLGCQIMMYFNWASSQFNLDVNTQREKCDRGYSFQTSKIIGLG